jgi:hypothetical protein
MNTDLVVVTNPRSHEVTPLLRQACRALNEGGRLVVFDWRSQVPIHQMVNILENNQWSITGHGSAGAGGYFLEAMVSDNSVQS